MNVKSIVYQFNTSANVVKIILEVTKEVTRMAMSIPLIKSSKNVNPIGICLTTFF